MISPLGDGDIERIHEATLTVLHQTGVWFRDCPEARAVLQQAGCVVDGDRVRFPGRLVDECLALLPNRDQLNLCVLGLSHADGLSLRKGDSHVGLVGNAYYIHDYQQGCERDCTEADVDEKALILDSLRNFEGDYCNLVLGSERYGGPVATPDYGEAGAAIGFVRKRVQERAGARDAARARGGRLPFRWLQRSPEEQRLEVLAHAVLHGSEATEDLLAQGDASFVWCNPVSPLQYHPDEAYAIINVAHDAARSRFVMISPEIMMGATGPVTLSGALIQHNAEVLAGTVLAQLAQAGTPVIYGCVSAVMDLRTAQISQGHLETAMLNAACVQMADHYGLPSRASPGNTSARRPGPRAAAETMVGLYIGLASGANLITTGLLDSTLMVSYEHLVLMDEMIDQVRSGLGGFRTDDLHPEIAQIEEHGHPSPGFIASDDTVRNMRRDVHYSDFAGRTESSYEDWYAKAHDRVKRILKARVSPPDLDEPTRERLAALERILTGDNQAWRREQRAWWRPYIRALG